VKCYESRSAVSITLKSKIRYNGQEYSSPAELPPDVRVAYEKAMREVPLKANFIVGHERFANGNAMHGDVRNLCDDVMSVIESNGEVTIPNGKRDPLLTKREIALVAVLTGGIAALIWARLSLG
jgi:hypothetical protein